MARLRTGCSTLLRATVWDEKVQRRFNTSVEPRHACISRMKRLQHSRSRMGENPAAALTWVGPRIAKKSPKQAATAYREPHTHTLKSVYLLTDNNMWAGREGKNSIFYKALFWLMCLCAQQLRLFSCLQITQHIPNNPATYTSRGSSVTSGSFFSKNSYLIRGKTHPSHVLLNWVFCVFLCYICLQKEV